MGTSTQTGFAVWGNAVRIALMSNDSIVIFEEICAGAQQLLGGVIKVIDKGSGDGAEGARTQGPCFTWPSG